MAAGKRIVPRDVYSRLAYLTACCLIIALYKVHPSSMVASSNVHGDDVEQRIRKFQTHHEADEEGELEVKFVVTAFNKGSY